MGGDHAAAAAAAARRRLVTSEGREPIRIPGREILREVLDAYQPYRETFAVRRTRVLILRFEASAGGPRSEAWVMRMRASAISAREKVRVFTALGAQVEEVVLPDTVRAAELVERIEAANADPDVAAIIVQSPPPARLIDEFELVRIDPGKDIDCLGVDCPWIACATADGICRVAEPFLGEGEVVAVAVVGSRGFVGRGVVAMLRERGHAPLELDAGDDLRQVRDADVVISTTGRAGLLTAEHLHSGHRLVVDSGFIPLPGGPVGDVDPSAQHLPQAITPVPGGIGPVEMATLAERLTIQQAAPDLSSWRYHGPVRGEDGGPLTTAHHDVEQQRAGAGAQLHEEQGRTLEAQRPSQREGPGVSPVEGDEAGELLRRQEEEALSREDDVAWRGELGPEDMMGGPTI